MSKSQLLKSIANKINELIRIHGRGGHYNGLSVCEVGHIDNCAQCSSAAERARYERISEIGR